MVIFALTIALVHSLLFMVGWTSEEGGHIGFIVALGEFA